ncbi:hypothetical protein Dimus_012202 [Dionaea muscipula]
MRRREEPQTANGRFVAATGVMADFRRPELHELILEGTSMVNSGKRAAKIPGSSSEEEVEFPVFGDDLHRKFQKNHGESINCVMDDDELISDDEEICAPCSSFNNRVGGSGLIDRLSVETEKQMEGNLWSAFCKDADELVNGRQTLRISDTGRIGRGGRGKSKSRYSFNFHGHNKRLVCSLVPKEKEQDPSESHLLDGLENIECRRSVEPSGVDLVCSEEIGKPDEGLPIVGVPQLGVAKNSMAELLDELQDKEGTVPASAKPSHGKKGRRRRLATNRSILSLGNRSMDGEDPFEDMHSGSSSENEGDAWITTGMEVKNRSVADQFEEVLGTDEGASVAVLGPRQSNVGLLGRLQSIMQREKERDLEFSRILHSKASLRDEVRSIVVKILSRCFDAKLIVCCCSVWDETRQREESFQGEDFGKTMTIIFSSRICGNIDFEVGKLICIHAPWREVEVFGGGDRMILATYFSYA